MLGGFRATSVRAGRSVCATARVVLLLATLVPEPSQRGMKEARKEGSGGAGGRAGGRVGRDGTGGQTAGRSPFLSFPFFPFSRVILKREVAEVSLAGSVVSDGFQEAIIIPTDVDG